MNYNKCGFGIGDCIALILSIAVAIVVGIFFAGGSIPGIVTFITIALITSAVIAFLLVILTILRSVSIKENSRCICCNATALLVGTFGTFIASVAAITSGIAVGSIASAVFVGLSALFFIFMIFKIFTWIRCAFLEKCC